MKEFDENAAVAAMRQALSPEKAQIYSDDDLLEVLDLIFDHYEESGALEPDLVEDEEDEEAMIAEAVEYIERFLRKSKDNKIDAADLPALVKAELDYEESLL